MRIARTETRKVGTKDWSTSDSHWCLSRYRFCRKTSGTHKRPHSRWRTKLGQKAEIFWMETRPTKSEIGKTQKIVEALQGFAIKKKDRISNEKVIPNTETDDPVLDKLNSGVRVNGWATEKQVK